MGKLLSFPRVGDPSRGCVHCWPLFDGNGYEIGHESRSGNSWGNFSQYLTADEAVAAAFRLARHEYGCDVHIAQSVLDACDSGPVMPPLDRGAF